MRSLSETSSLPAHDTGLCSVTGVLRKQGMVLSLPSFTSNLETAMSLAPNNAYSIFVYRRANAMRPLPEHEISRRGLGLREETSLDE